MEEWISRQFADELATMRAEHAADAMTIATAAYARVELAHRLAASAGLTVWLTTTAEGDDQPFGALVEVLGGAVLVESADASWLVPLPAILAVGGLAAAHAPIAGVDRRLGLGHLLRQRTGTEVVAASGSRRWSGRLGRVGADHFEMTDPPALIALAGLGWVRARGR